MTLAADEGEESALDGEPEIVAELGLDGHIMRRLLLAGSILVQFSRRVSGS